LSHCHTKIENHHHYDFTEGFDINLARAQASLPSSSVFLLYLLEVTPTVPFHFRHIVVLLFTFLTVKKTQTTLTVVGMLGGFATWRYFDVIDSLEEEKFIPDKVGPIVMSTFLALSATAFTTWIVSLIPLPYTEFIPITSSQAPHSSILTSLCPLQIWDNVELCHPKPSGPMQRSKGGLHHSFRDGSGSPVLGGDEPQIDSVFSPRKSGDMPSRRSRDNRHDSFSLRLQGT